MKTAYDTLIRLETREVEQLRLDLATAAEAARRAAADAEDLAQRQQAEAALAAADPLVFSPAWIGLARRRTIAGKAAATAAAAHLEAVRGTAAERLARLRSMERLADDVRRTALAARDAAEQREIEDLQAARRGRRP